MVQDVILTYPDDHITYDYAYLKYLLLNERDIMLVSYIEQEFMEESKDYQFYIMIKYPFFSNKILDNFEMSNEEKQEKLFDKITFGEGGKIILVDGCRGGGKTGFGAWVLDELHKRFPDKIFYWVTKSDAKIPLPKWIKIVSDVLDVPNGAVALIDEGAIQLSSRRSGTRENIDASDRLITLRHKGITMIILVQNVLMVDVNVRRLADVRVLKYGIPFGVERKKYGDIINKDLELLRNRLRPNNNHEAYIEISSDKVYLRFTHTLPLWWDDDKISKSFKNIDMRKIFEKQRKIIPLIPERRSISGIT